MINQKMGKDSLQIGGIRKEAPWQIRHDRLTQRYTTRWSELLEVK